MLGTALALVAACGGDAGPAEDVGALALSALHDPEPPGVGRNALVVTVADAAGGPVVGATVTVVPEMPSMGHGSPETPTVEDRGDGTYRAWPVTYSMPGPWEVRVRAEHGGEHGVLVLHVEIG